MELEAISTIVLSLTGGIAILFFKVLINIFCFKCPRSMAIFQDLTLIKIASDKIKKDQITF